MSEVEGPLGAALKAPLTGRSCVLHSAAVLGPWPIAPYGWRVVEGTPQNGTRNRGVVSLQTKQSSKGVPSKASAVSDPSGQAYYGAHCTSPCTSGKEAFIAMSSKSQ